MRALGVVVLTVFLLAFQFESAPAIELDRARLPYYGSFPFDRIGKTGEAYGEKQLLSLGDEVMLTLEAGKTLKQGLPYLVAKAQVPWKASFYEPIAVVRPLFKNGGSAYVGEVVEIFGLFDASQTYGLYDVGSRPRRMQVQPTVSRYAAEGKVEVVYGLSRTASVGQYVGVALSEVPSSSLHPGTKVYFYSKPSWWKEAFGRSKPPKVYAEGLVVFVGERKATVLLTHGENVVKPGARVTTVLY
jgi:hypothetical protein